MDRVYKLFNADSFSSLVNKLFVEKRTNHGLVQFVRYLFVGGFSAVVNLVLLYVFTSLVGVNYLFSELIAFIVATLVNYLLSVLWIFSRSKFFKLELTIFTAIGVAGLGINELVLWICVSKFHLKYLIGEVVAILVVMLWSFFLRKIMFEKLKSRESI